MSQPCQKAPADRWNLLYTGVTRGKRLVVLVGQKEAIAIAGSQRLGPAALVEARRVATFRRALAINLAFSLPD